jgi:Tfp pilus assembly pilus retraction ATPase PilT
MDITDLLAFSVQQGASDLHLSAGLPPMIRVDGDVRRVNVPAQDHAEVQALVAKGIITVEAALEKARQPDGITS